jgi:hypothetical protein
MTYNISMSNHDNIGFRILKAIQPRPDQIAWPKNQRKNRKNARRAFAAGNRRAFNNQ